MSQVPPDLELQAVESALRGLAPVAGRLDRDRLMYRAGASSQLAAARRPWTWPSVAAVLAAALATELFVLATRPAPAVVERVVVVRDVPSPPDSSPIPQAGAPAPAAVAGGSRASSVAGDTLAQAAWASSSDYQRLQNLVLRFGLDALPERPFRSAAASGSGVPEEAPFEPAGALRRLEMEKFQQSGGSS